MPEIKSGEDGAKTIMKASEEAKTDKKGTRR
jgi:hypothetical protein